MGERSELANGGDGEEPIEVEVEPFRIDAAVGAEWERAARAATATIWPWGDEREPGGRHLMNVWQGGFPGDDTGADGYVGTAPVRSYEPNPWALRNMVGNDWEWTVDDHGLCFPGAARTGRRVLKRGSYLCHASYCSRYGPAGGIGSPPDASAGNVGFGCASNIAV